MAILLTTKPATPVRPVFTHVQQPPRSRLCGQACVAMLTGMTLAGAVRLVTDGRKRVTSENDLRRALERKGMILYSFWRPQGTEGAGWRTSVVLARTRTACRPNGYHWVLINGQTVHDPALDRPVPWPAYWRMMRRRRTRITSWAVLGERR